MLCAKPGTPAETADESSLGIMQWTVSWRGWGRPAFLSCEPALTGNLWHWNRAGCWDGTIRNRCSQSLSGRALSNSFGLSPRVKAVMLTHTEVVGRGKRWKTCITASFKMLWGSQNVFLASETEQSCCRALESEQALRRLQVSVQTHMLCSEYAIKWSCFSFCGRACSHGSLGLAVKRLIQGGPAKIRFLAKLGYSCKLLIVSRCHSLVQGEEMEEGKESAQIQVDDGVPRMPLDDTDGDGSCAARCPALTPCQGLPAAGFRLYSLCVCCLCCFECCRRLFGFVPF